jgi:hypothetical protein
VGVTADIVECEHAFPGVADDDLPPTQGDRAHAALRNIGEKKGLLELLIAHVAHLVGEQVRAL